MVAKTPKTGTHRRGHKTPRVVQRWADAVALKVGGNTYDEIAIALGYAHRSAARKAVQSGLAETLHDAGTEELRQIEHERLEKLHSSRWPKALEGDGDESDDAYALVLRTMERRAKLLGLDAPVKLQHSGDPEHPVVVKVLRNVKVDSLR